MEPDRGRCDPAVAVVDLVVKRMTMEVALSFQLGVGTNCEVVNRRDVHSTDMGFEATKAPFAPVPYQRSCA